MSAEYLCGLFLPSGLLLKRCIMEKDSEQQVAERALESGVELALSRWVPISARALIDGEVTDVDAGLAPPPGVPPRKRCHAESLVDLAASGRTGDDGSVTLRIQDSFCRHLNIEDLNQVWVVALPRSREAVHLTHVLVPPFDPPGPIPQDPNDVRIRFFSWDSSGAPKPHVFFTWRVLFVTYSDPVE
jgi:hypothetical protein